MSKLSNKQIEKYSRQIIIDSIGISGQKKIIDTNYKKATKLLKDNLDKLHTMAESLLTYETIDSDQIDDIMAGAKPRAPKDWDEPKTPKSKTSKKTSIKGPAEEL